jgi:hypothetical protein
VHRPVVGRVEPLSVPRVGEDGDTAVVVVAHDATSEVLEADLAPFPVEGVAVAVVGPFAEHADVAVVVEPA